MPKLPPNTTKHWSFAFRLHMSAPLPSDTVGEGVRASPRRLVPGALPACVFPQYDVADNGLFLSVDQKELQHVCRGTSACLRFAVFIVLGTCSADPPLKLFFYS